MAKAKTAANKAAAKTPREKKTKTVPGLQDMTYHDPKNREVTFTVTADSITVAKEATGVSQTFKNNKVEAEAAHNYFYHLVDCSQN